ncbi:MAG: hypothetical protein ABR557_03355 [Pyrinomonadaceae bacterium]
MKRIGRFSLVPVALLVILFVAARNYCPPHGVALTTQRRGFQQLKNRTALPQPSDFDTRVTLEMLLQPGDDRSRWSNARPVRIEGQVVGISLGPLEAANCFCRRDIHIMLASRLGAPPREQVVLEITPRMETTKEWSMEKLARDLVGRRARFEGWLFFDSLHAGESENIAPGRANNWRATAWEVHPITKIEILN